MRPANRASCRTPSLRIVADLTKPAASSRKGDRRKAHRVQNQLPCRKPSRPAGLARLRRRCAEDRHCAGNWLTLPAAAWALLAATGAIPGAGGRGRRFRVCPVAVALDRAVSPDCLLLSPDCVAPLVTEQQRGRGPAGYERSSLDSRPGLLLPRLESVAAGVCRARRWLSLVVLRGRDSSPFETCALAAGELRAARARLLEAA